MSSAPAQSPRSAGTADITIENFLKAELDLEALRQLEIPGRHEGAG